MRELIGLRIVKRKKQKQKQKQNKFAKRTIWGYIYYEISDNKYHNWYPENWMPETRRKQCAK